MQIATDCDEGNGSRRPGGIQANEEAFCRKFYSIALLKLWYFHDKPFLKILLEYIRLVFEIL